MTAAVETPPQRSRKGWDIALTIVLLVWVLGFVGYFAAVGWQ